MYLQRASVLLLTLVDPEDINMKEQVICFLLETIL